MYILFIYKHIIIYYIYYNQLAHVIMEAENSHDLSF